LAPEKLRLLLCLFLLFLHVGVPVLRLAHAFLQLIHKRVFGLQVGHNQQASALFGDNKHGLGLARWGR
jgi:hypothetical protein